MRFWLGVTAVLALAAVLLLGPERVVRGGADGARLLFDTDPHYHVLRAERMARGGAGATWRDPALDWPEGADVPWPPLFDAALVTAARVADARTRDDIARAGALVPPLLGLLSLLLVAVAGRALAGPAVGLAAAAAAAVLPPLLHLAVVGRVDQHVAEILLATAIAAAFTAGLGERRGPAAPLALGLFTALAFWTWMGSTVALVAPCAAIALARLGGADALAARGARTLVAGAAIGGLLLAASVAALGAPGALGRPSVLGVGALQLAIVAGVACFSALVAWRARRPAGPAARLVEVTVALGVPAALLLSLWPALREGVARGLVALAAGNPWYEDISEFAPALFAGLRPVSQEVERIVSTLGLLPVLAVLAIPAGLRRAREEPAARGPLFFLGVWGATTLAFAVARIRFFPYFAVPCAIAAALGARWLGEVFARRLGRASLAAVLAGAALVLALLPVASTTRRIVAGELRVPERWIEATRWLRHAPPAPDGRATVAAPWELGHLVQYYADRPVIASPFGTEAGARAIPDWAAILFATDDAAAEEVLRRRGVAQLVLRNPSHELVGLRGYAPPGGAPLLVTRDVWRGESVEATPLYPELFVFRLYFGDGSGLLGRPVEGARLLFEGASTRPEHPLHEEKLKVFGVVPGAALRVRGADPGALLTAAVPVRTNTGRTFTWAATRVADGAGTATFRIPYASGENGAARAGACTVSEGGRSARSPIPADAVETGGTVDVSLAAAGKAAPSH